MTDLIKSQRTLKLKELKISSNSKEMSKVHEQLEKLFATSVIVTVEQKTSQIHSNKRPSWLSTSEVSFIPLFGIPIVEPSYTIDEG